MKTIVDISKIWMNVIFVYHQIIINLHKKLEANYPICIWEQVFSKSGVFLLIILTHTVMKKRRFITSAKQINLLNPGSRDLNFILLSFVKVKLDYKWSRKKQAKSKIFKSLTKIWISACFFATTFSLKQSLIWYDCSFTCSRTGRQERQEKISY